MAADESERADIQAGLKAQKALIGLLQKRIGAIVRAKAELWCGPYDAGKDALRQEMCMNDDQKQLRFIAHNEQGECVEYDVVLTFEAVSSGNNIIVYTDGSQDEVGNLKIFASVYDPEELAAAESGGIADLKLGAVEEASDRRILDEILCEMAAAAAEAGSS